MRAVEAGADGIADSGATDSARPDVLATDELVLFSAGASAADTLSTFK